MFRESTFPFKTFEIKKNDIIIANDKNGTPEFECWWIERLIFGGNNPVSSKYDKKTITLLFNNQLYNKKNNKPAKFYRYTNLSTTTRYDDERNFAGRNYNIASDNWMAKEFDLWARYWDHGEKIQYLGVACYCVWKAVQHSLDHGDLILGLSCLFLHKIENNHYPSFYYKLLGCLLDCKKESVPGVTYPQEDGTKLYDWSLHDVYRDPAQNVTIANQKYKVPTLNHIIKKPDVFIQAIKKEHSDAAEFWLQRHTVDHPKIIYKKKGVCAAVLIVKYFSHEKAKEIIEKYHSRLLPQFKDQKQIPHLLAQKNSYLYLALFKKESDAKSTLPLCLKEAIKHKNTTFVTKYFETTKVSDYSLDPIAQKLVGFMLEHKLRPDIVVDILTQPPNLLNIRIIFDLLAAGVSAKNKKVFEKVVDYIHDLGIDLSNFAVQANIIYSKTLEMESTRRFTLCRTVLGAGLEPETFAKCCNSAELLKNIMKQRQVYFNIANERLFDQILVKEALKHKNITLATYTLAVQRVDLSKIFPEGKGLKNKKDVAKFYRKHHKASADIADFKFNYSEELLNLPQQTNNNLVSSIFSRLHVMFFQLASTRYSCTIGNFDHETSKHLSENNKVISSGIQHWRSKREKIKTTLRIKLEDHAKSITKFTAIKQDAQAIGNNFIDHISIAFTNTPLKKVFTATIKLVPAMRKTDDKISNESQTAYDFLSIISEIFLPLRPDLFVSIQPKQFESGKLPAIKDILSNFKENDNSNLFINADKYDETVNKNKAKHSHKPRDEYVEEEANATNNVESTENKPKRRLNLSSYLLGTEQSAPHLTRHLISLHEIRDKSNQFNTSIQTYTSCMEKGDLCSLCSIYVQEEKKLDPREVGIHCKDITMIKTVFYCREIFFPEMGPNVEERFFTMLFDNTRIKNKENPKLESFLLTSYIAKFGDNAGILSKRGKKKTFHKFYLEARKLRKDIIHLGKGSFDTEHGAASAVIAERFSVVSPTKSQNLKFEPKVTLSANIDFINRLKYKLRLECKILEKELTAILEPTISDFKFIALEELKNIKAGIKKRYEHLKKLGNEIKKNEFIADFKNTIQQLETIPCFDSDNPGWFHDTILRLLIDNCENSNESFYLFHVMITTIKQAYTATRSNHLPKEKLDACKNLIKIIWRLFKPLCEHKFPLNYPKQLRLDTDSTLPLHEIPLSEIYDSEPEHNLEEEDEGEEEEPVEYKVFAAPPSGNSGPTNEEEVESSDPEDQLPHVNPDTILEPIAFFDGPPPMNEKKQEPEKINVFPNSHAFLPPSNPITPISPSAPEMTDKQQDNFEIS